MKIEDAVRCMTKAYLHRILDSYTKDIHKPDEEESRQRLIRDAEDLASPESIRKRFDLSQIDFRSKTLITFVLEVILEQPDFQSSESDLITSVIDREKELVETAGKDDALKYRNQEAIRTYKTVLEVALQDEIITEDEKRLLRRLRSHLGLRIQDHYILQARLDRFPKPGNELHTAKEVKQELSKLQKMGILFYCNQADSGPLLVLPEELVPGIKSVLGIELQESAYLLLLSRLSRDQLKKVLDENGLPTSGSKDEQSRRVIAAGIEPSQALDYLHIDELKQLCKALPGVKVSGVKAQRIENVITYFDGLRPRDSVSGEDERATLYDFYVELAKRDRANLLGNKVISKDIQIDRAFEEATRYLFEIRCGLSHRETPGNEHADGVFEVPARDTLIMWDTKSKESVYAFPNDHLRQFKRYIRDADKRVECFIVIVPDVAPTAIDNAYKLKLESGRDSDVALVAAEDLKWLAEHWREYHKNSERLNLDVLNLTGILTRQVMEQRLKILGAVR